MTKTILLAATAPEFAVAPASVIVILNLQAKPLRTPIDNVANVAGTTTTITASNAPVAISQILDRYADYRRSLISTLRRARSGNADRYRRRFAALFEIILDYQRRGSDSGTNFQRFVQRHHGVDPSGMLGGRFATHTISFTSDNHQGFVVAFDNRFVICCSMPAFSIDNATIASFTQSSIVNIPQPELVACAC